MFSLFKSKQNLIPNDIKNGMLTMSISTFKVGDSITIPENTICLIRYKDKTYKELTTETYSLNKEFLLDLYSKQIKRKEKIKKLKADLYFINLNSFTYEFEFTNKIPLNNEIINILFSIEISLNVNDVKKFSNFIIYENPLASSHETQAIILEFAENFLRKFYCKRKLENTIITFEQKQELFTYVQKAFSKVGVSLNNLEVQLFKKSKRGSKKDSNNSNIFANTQDLHTNEIKTELIDSNNKNSLDQPQELNYTKEVTNEDLCPQCKSTFIKSSLFCHKCGYKK